MPQRKFLKPVEGTFPTHYRHEARENYLEVSAGPDALLVSSETNRGTHMPAIDLDMPASLVPSSTEGHSHLFIDVEMSWRKYRGVLRALYRAGVIERGFYKASLARRRTQLRTEIFKKTAAEKAAARV